MQVELTRKQVNLIRDLIWKEVPAVWKKDRERGEILYEIECMLFNKLQEEIDE